MKATLHSLFTVLIVFLLSGSTLSLNAQLSFSMKNDLLGPGSYHSGLSVAIADMNADGYDDIVRLSQGRELIIEYQQKDGGIFVTEVIGQVSNESQWTMCVADIDNNGYNDVLTGGSYDGIRASMAGEFGGAHTTITLPGPNMFAQGSNMVDINNDGWIDVFVCHDDAESRIWGNDGAGNLAQADEWIDMRTTPASDNSGNYGSIWTDFDNDGDIDLYIAKCRQFVSNEEDPRRINALYVNDGNGNYTEDAESYGLKIGAQSWTSDFQDIDNDGDLDCFITNHDNYSSQILENDGTGHFTDISADAGMTALDFPLQGVMRDFDNDGFVDILISGGEAHYYKNNGDKTFTRENGSLFGTQDMHSYAIGDLNHDGFLDIYASYGNGYVNPTIDDDLIWMNNGNDNNYLAVNLDGVISNNNGIGARIKVYGAWGVQIREVRSGESYGIHNSFIQHFGLGTNTTIDSVVINWPSGIIDKFEDVDINQFINVIEDGCISPNANLTLTGVTTFCSGDSLIITAPEGLSYEWSSGATTQAITVYAGGIYNVTVSDGGTCLGVSSNVKVTVDPDETPTITTDQEVINCPGTPVTISASESAGGYLWSTGESTQSIIVDKAGSYTVQVPGLCADFTSMAFEIFEFDVPLPETIGDTIINFGSGTLTATGDSLLWYDMEVGGIFLGSGPSYMTPELGETTTFWVENWVTFDDEPFKAGKEEKGDDGSYSDNNFRGLDLQIEEEVRLLSAKVYAQAAGERSIGFFNRSTSEDLGTVTIMIPEGESRIELDKEFPVSDNIFMFISNNAGLYHDNEGAGVEFPYSLGKYGSILPSQNGNYYYFYDLEFEAINPVVCVSERAPVVLQVDPNVAVQEISASDAIHLFPNPTETRLQLQLDLENDALVQIYDLQGRVVYQSDLEAKSTESVQVDQWARGVYFARVYAGEDIFVEKVILQ